MKNFEAICAAANRRVSVAVAILLGMATAAVLIQIGVRFVLPLLSINISAPWTEESARFLMTWSVFLGAAVLCRQGRLIAITILPDYLPARIGRMVVLSGTALTTLFFAILLLLGSNWAIASMSETATVLRIPMGLVYAAMPVGAALSILNLGLFARDVCTSQLGISPRPATVESE
ncbi:TRAP transporter small permease [Devosia neptuniae]|uniref:TRAP transporter small permease n=1 Tax=Devosia neptuniae TaxID=191302 RepID=UPI0022AFC69D|nr:TRAP transporter small permease [Devosia neptuniae]MCZ4345517.1 TRAP transporter small permease [Devosia neptuniae]